MERNPIPAVVGGYALPASADEVAREVNGLYERIEDARERGSEDYAYALERRAEYLARYLPVGREVY